MKKHLPSLRKGFGRGSQPLHGTKHLNPTETMKNQFKVFIATNLRNELNETFEPAIVAQCYEALNGFTKHELKQLAELIEAAQTEEETSYGI